MTEAGYLCSAWFRDKTYSFKGRHVLFAQDEPRNEAYTWIRDNTPHDSLLMLSYVVTPYWDNTAHIMSYRPAVLSERSLFVIKDVYTFISPDYEHRVRIRKKLFKDPGDPLVVEYFSSLNRPVFLLIEEGYDDSLFKNIFDPRNSIFL